VSRVSAEEARGLLEGATPGPWTHDGPGGEIATAPRCFIFGGGRIVSDYPRMGNGHGDANAKLIAAAPSLARTVIALTEERDAYKRAKAENDERFMLERDEARAALEALPKWGDYGWRDAAASVAAKLREDASQIAALMSERDEARRERDRLRLMYATLRQTLVGTDERPWGVTIETTFKGTESAVKSLRSLRRAVRNA
jgi:hypothetical protein